MADSWVVSLGYSHKGGHVNPKDSLVITVTLRPHLGAYTFMPSFLLCSFYPGRTAMLNRKPKDAGPKS